MPLPLLLFLAAAPADLEAGRQIYMGSCSGCHGATGEGSQGPSLLSGRVSRMPERALAALVKNGLPGTSMPNFDLPDGRLRQLTAFVRSLTAPAIMNPPAGDAGSGRAYFNGTGGCSGCHRILGEGGALGPDLSNAGAERTLHQLRESITKPSARIANGFATATATLTNGRKLEGVAKNHNNYSVQLLDKSGRLHLIPRAEIARFETSGDSLMPAVTDPAAVQNLLAYLARQSSRPLAAEGNEP